MPGMPGNEFIRRLRADERLKQVRVILISGCNNVAAMAEKYGADGFMGKPFGLEDIAGLVFHEDASANSLPPGFDCMEPSRSLVPVPPPLSNVV